MSWVWTAAVVWVLLAVPTSILVGRAIRRADREERRARDAALDNARPRPARDRPTSTAS